jgi:hypothetical protein
LNDTDIRARAQQTVARHATDPADCARLLAILGLSEDPTTDAVPNTEGPENSAKSGEFVPVEDLHRVLGRIKHMRPDMKNAAIGRSAGLDEGSFANSLRKGRRVRRSTYTAVLRLAEKLDT